MTRYWMLPAAVSVSFCLTLCTARALIGGEEAGIDEFPWEVGLQKVGEDTIHCGGAHIGSGWIITAAHCVRGRKRADLKVFYGSKFVLSGKTEPLVADPLVHEGWQPENNFQNDIALVKIDAPADLMAARMILAAVEKPVIDQGAPLTISGWGKTDPEGPNNLELRKARMTVGDRSTCADLYKPEPLSDVQVCLGSGTSGGCSGDSGGPITGLDTNGTVLVGITSKAGPKCALRYPTVFTRITQFRQWIRATCERSGLSPNNCPN